ncbi:hypothetical protein [Echinimonas agarilytica]|uniref:Uncharacterized protein n=1 Tax=Echinimonas agarilytica TaxID=1215918 RepID=A0AA41W537_9GAMM|nr:hypothetical protein [Echinimonas agarilytica]MCM2678662.1 hypothetical protein [Echinimonas agarilytica]
MKKLVLIAGIFAALMSAHCFAKKVMVIRYAQAPVHSFNSQLQEAEQGAQTWASDPKQAVIHFIGQPKENLTLLDSDLPEWVTVMAEMPQPNDVDAMIYHIEFDQKKRHPSVQFSDVKVAWRCKDHPDFDVSYCD